MVNSVRNKRQMLGGIVLLFGLASCSGSRLMVSKESQRSLTSYPTLEIAPFESEVRGTAADKIDPDNLLEMRADLLKRLQKERLFRSVTMSADQDTGVLLLKTTVIDYEPGSRLARYFIGFGAGKAEVEVNCQFIEKATGRIVSETSVSGYIAMGGAGGSVRDAYREATKRIVKYIKETGK